ncbi:MAG TPA: alpha/beta fold hydrolase [Acidimicrobiales bacterium]|nr:alpha/beta fold hydrolase [Acidimicrobiales bacterium]
MSTESAPQFISIHGHQVAYRAAGDGSAILLIHGIAGSSTTWARALPLLANNHSVVAPDLLGHGESAKPRGDYSLGAYASGIRDLMTALGHERATIVGHSLGGGIAMQFAYQFPERCERLVLVASGGLGKEVAPLLKAISLPGAEYVLPVILRRELNGVVSRVVRAIGRVGVKPDPFLAEVLESWTRLTDARAQRAFVHTIRSVIDIAGQRVSARDRLYLASEVPTMIVWGDRDGIIPVEHAHIGHELMPGSRLEIFNGVGHFLPVQEPERFVALLEDFIATTEPARVSEARWREILTTAS